MAVYDKFIYIPSRSDGTTLREDELVELAPECPACKDTGLLSDRAFCSCMRGTQRFFGSAPTRFTRRVTSPTGRR